MSKAAAIANADVYTVGTGRVDVGKATAQPVTATGSLAADLPWPNQGARATRTVSWRNTSSAPVSLTVDIQLTDQDGAAAPEGLATLSASTVTVPADGTAAIDIIIAAQDVKVWGFLNRRRQPRAAGWTPCTEARGHPRILRRSMPAASSY